MNRVVIALLAAAALLIGIALGSQVGPVRDGADDLFGQGNESATQQAIDLINDDYFKTVDDADLENASVTSIVDRLKQRYGDRFSHYFTPAEYARFKQGARFSGVGLAVSEVKGGLRVATVYKRTPAEEARIQPGDVITEVEGKSIAGEDADAVTARIRGAAGTKVTITVRSGGGKSRSLTLTRREVNIPQVSGRILDVRGQKVGYVRLAGFFPGAHGELRKKIDQLNTRGAGAYVLDLRGNGGGLLTEAVLVSSIFVPRGTIVSTQGRTQATRTFKATGDSIPAKPTVVLVNHDTASASEIVTAALGQAGIAKVVGTRSFGKGTFQEVIPLDNGGALDLTVGEYLTRNGSSINGTGIKPQVKVKDNPKTKPDEARDRALQVLAPQLP